MKNIKSLIIISILLIHSSFIYCDEYIKLNLEKIEMKKVSNIENIYNNEGYKINKNLILIAGIEKITNNTILNDENFGWKIYLLQKTKNNYKTN